MRKDARYLQDILEAVEQDELNGIWVLHHLQIIGEAARSLSGPLNRSHPEIAWRRIGDLRNVLVHQYFDVDMGIVRTILDRDLADLKARVAAMLPLPDDLEV